MIKKYFTIIAVLISMAFPLFAASSVPELDRLKLIYQQGVKRLKITSQTQRLHIPQNHIKAMRALELVYQNSGDLKSLLAVRKERERFIEDPRVDTMIPVETPNKLRSLQESYISNYSSITKNRTQEIDT